MLITKPTVIDETIQFMENLKKTEKITLGKGAKPMLFFQDIFKSSFVNFSVHYNTFLSQCINS